MSDDTERAGPEGQGSSEPGQPDERPFDASDPEQVNQRRRDAKRRDLRHREVVQRIMGTTDGRAWLFDFLVGCHMNATSFDMNDRVHAFREGERNIGLKVQAEMQRFPTEYLLMLKENGKNL